MLRKKVEEREIQVRAIEEKSQEFVEKYKISWKAAEIYCHALNGDHIEDVKSRMDIRFDAIEDYSEVVLKRIE